MDGGRQRDPAVERLAAASGELANSIHEIAARRPGGVFAPWFLEQVAAVSDAIELTGQVAADAAQPPTDEAASASA